MKYTAKPLLLSGVVLMSLTACEGGREFDAAPRADHQGFIQTQGGGIRAVVDNRPYDYSGDRRLTHAGEGRRSLKVLSLASDHSYWQILALPNLPGQYACDDQLQIQLQREGMGHLSSVSCQLTLSLASPQQLLGQFTGQLANADGQVFSLENGIFDIQLNQVIPDLDEDGLADADDNCPFDANPDQADSDGNRRGDACEPEGEEEA